MFRKLLAFHYDFFYLFTKRILYSLSVLHDVPDDVVHFFTPLYNPFASQLIDLHQNGHYEGSARAPLIEVCPTSNLFTLNLTSYGEHPTLGRWMELGYPVAVSTGMMFVFGCGVFSFLFHGASVKLLKLLYYFYLILPSFSFLRYPICIL
jgi:hypothetical protein